MSVDVLRKKDKTCVHSISVNKISFKVINIDYLNTRDVVAVVVDEVNRFTGYYKFLLFGKL